MCDREIWKDIKGYEGLYQVSNLGRVKSLKKWDVNIREYVDTEYILSPSSNGKGYLIVGLRKGTTRKNHYVHRLVASAFVEKPEGCNYVNHIDFDTQNNIATNLEWCTQKDNIHHSAHRMRHRNSYSRTNTGEMYICYRKGRYRLTIDRKEYPSFATLEEAVKKRDDLLKEVI